MQKRRIVFTFNAPFILLFAIVSLGALGLSILTGEKSNQMVFSVYRSPFSMLYILRLFCHVLGHADFTHYLSNMASILALGAIVEERYGSMRLFIMCAVTAVVSALFHLRMDHKPFKILRLHFTRPSLDLHITEPIESEMLTNIPFLPV